MIPSLTATHSLIRNKGADPASSGSAGSAPACYPRPPTTAVAFAVSGLAQLDLTISTAISPAKSLATITTAQLAANVALVVRGAVPGCTFAITGSPVVSGIQVSGTPTTYGDTWGNDVIGVWLNAGTVTFYVNGVSQGAAYSGLSGTMFPGWGSTTASAGTRSATIRTAPPFSYLPGGAGAWG